ncbi:MAG TPA: hypothetical protein VMG30_05340 [Acidobacteriota bacterium]|nr:hypothetical protein [Acidobacteriota bacterium]
MRWFVRVLLAVVMAGTLLFAGSTKFSSIYQNPRAGRIDFSGKKVACFVIIPNEELRGAREETVAAELRSRGVNGIAGYTILPGALVKDREKSKEFLQKAGVSAACIIRLLGDKEQALTTTVTTAWYTQPYYSNFWGYWNYGWSSVAIYETSWTDRVITLETLIYSIERDELLWAGRSETTNPKDITKFVQDLVKEAGKTLRKAGLVPK